MDHHATLAPDLAEVLAEHGITATDTLIAQLADVADDHATHTTQQAVRQIRTEADRVAYQARRAAEERWRPAYERNRDGGRAAALDALVAYIDQHAAPTPGQECAAS